MYVSTDSNIADVMTIALNKVTQRQSTKKLFHDIERIKQASNLVTRLSRGVSYVDMIIANRHQAMNQGQFISCEQNGHLILGIPSTRHTRVTNTTASTNGVEVNVYNI